MSSFDIEDEDNDVTEGDDLSQDLLAETQQSSISCNSFSWADFTNDLDPHKITHSMCKHCNKYVSHHKKSERAKAHLLRCNAYINSMEEETQPVWYIMEQENKRLKLSSTPLSQPSIEQSSSYLPDMTQKELDKLEEAIAMHYYITGTSFVRIEESHLLEAFQVCRPDVVLPTRK
jgi:hypothetical protein